MDDKKKKYERPELTIVNFDGELNTDDIITQSLTDGGAATWDGGFGEDY